MTDNKQEPEVWTHAPLIVGWNDDGSLQTVDSWGVKPILTAEEREAIRWAEHEAQAFAEMGGGPHGFKFAATLRALLERSK